MARGNRIFVGQRVRELRLESRLDQPAMARLLGISVPYLSQLENDDRPLTARVKAALAAAFPLDWSSFDERPEEQLLGAFNWALANPGHGSPPPAPERAERLHLHYPDFAARYVELHHALRQAEQRLAIMEEAIATETLAAPRSPWAQVGDWFHGTANYIHALDTAAEDLSLILGLTEGATALIDALISRHRCETVLAETEPHLLRALSPDGKRLTINASLPTASQTFQLACQLMQFELSDQIEEIVSQAGVDHPAARHLLMLALVNYAAGALLMPYGAFRQAARSLRNDVDQLSRQFGTSFEQSCHRLATLQRPGQRSVPFYFYRVDLAGNITKRRSATRLEFARYGGACPLWSAHDAVARPDDTIFQFAEMPDGVRYLSIARGIAKPLAGAGQQARRYAIILGCEASHAANFIYADAMNLAAESPDPIGPTCRLCPRSACAHRAFPPLDRSIHIEQGVRRIVPYGID